MKKQLLICLLIFSSALLCSCATADYGTASDPVEELYSHRTLYIGNASEVSAVLVGLGLPYFTMELQTSLEPYSASVHCVVTDIDARDFPSYEESRAQAALFFALVENASQLSIDYKLKSNSVLLEQYFFTETELVAEYGDLWQQADSWESFRALYDSLMTEEE